LLVKHTVWWPKTGKGFQVHRNSQYVTSEYALALS
jgi:hypothetical protein